MKYFSMFTGIGGFEVAIDNALENAECIGYSEINKFACSVFEKHYEGVPNYGDATKINTAELPDFELIVGGFPCQAFSVAGKRGGFNDTRGTLFFDVARVIKDKRPRYLVLENVKGLLSHDDGKTFQTILGVLTDLGYNIEWQICNSKFFGVPQNRERVYIVGRLGGEPGPKVFPLAGAEPEAHTPSEATSEGTPAFIKTRHLRQNGSLISDNTTVQASETPHVVQLYGKSQDQRVYDQNGLSPTLNTMQGGNKQPKIRVVSATKQGYEEAEVGDGINIGAAGSSTRRGRVQKQATPTLNTLGDIGTLVAKTIRVGGGGSPYGSKQNWDSYEIGGVIRRLTPRECERLQAFPDDWTEFGIEHFTDNHGLLQKRLKPISDSQRYKMCGNAITTKVAEEVIRRLFS